MRNWECGMRKEKKPKEVFEFGIGNAEGGFIRFRIWDLGFKRQGVETECSAND